jgi:hypothetical protein
MNADTVNEKQRKGNDQLPFKFRQFKYILVTAINHGIQTSILG